MAKLFLYSFLVFTLFQILACTKETDPKKAFDKGDYEAAFNLWLPLAQAGDTDAQNYLGIIYYLGLGKNRDYKKALKWYERAAKAGNANAQKNYGDMINVGRGIQKNNYDAYKWYFAAARQGNKRAKKQINVIAASGNLSPNQQMHAKIEANDYIIDKTKRFMSYDTYLDKK